MAKRSSIWQYLIIASFTVYALFLLVSIILMSRQRVELVTPNYYTNELAYQSRIDHKLRSAELENRLQLNFDQERNHLRIVFPSDVKEPEITGEIVIYRPSDAALDKHYTINPSVQGVQTIPTTDFQKGLWRVKVEWQFQGEFFYNEAKFIIP